ncbi:CAP domain-containing protein [Kitasatospora purpeofusca]|uniref:CAP domain-containing protein n=1 Tax=Kitasatospora purpeofusca TaxID=67352 RepID=UPI002A5A16AE|nr:CAP domain-containing protein [Kitasatospora purpeofusca]MDY0811816.1 CAP domain-containing protein [Kitasatospora purpeofusca]
MPTLPQHGQTWTLKSANGTVADVRSGQTAAGTAVQSWGSNGTIAQGWTFWAKEGGSWLLETQLTVGRHAPGQAMVMDYNYSIGQAWLYHEHNRPNQHWCVEAVDNDWFRIRTTRADEGALFLTAAAPGSPLTLSKQDDADPAQRWQLTAAGGVSGGGQQQQQQPQPQPQPGGDFRTEMLNAVNAERGRVGAQPVRLDDRLSAAAQRHANDMASHDLTQHDGTDGSSPWDRIRDAGFTSRASAENVTPGNSVPEAMRMWMNSPHHRDNILSPAYNHIGIGYAPRQRGNWGRYVQTFGQA